LQDVTILDPVVNIQDIGVTQEKAEPIKTLPFNHQTNKNKNLTLFFFSV